ncbi:hypothetical protein B0H17DRAFT_1141456 [Mycena rosella]|uniref:Uncharacterized protein n=1 Tax=Mycena rosella TaxID=1033263 RepID=A0AAD7CZK1_MYCRO|nr:hypothetical protein B0H17DRAFT_1141456 [Mycena rosella]
MCGKKVDHKITCGSSGAKPLFTRWINGEAHTTDNKHSESSDREDDTENNICWCDERNFDMPIIVAGHEARLHSQERYCIPDDLLQPARHAPDTLPPISPAAHHHSRQFLPPLNSLSLPAPSWQPGGAWILLFVPGCPRDSPSLTPPLSHARTPLFLPETHEPTPEVQSFEYAEDHTSQDASMTVGDPDTILVSRDSSREPAAKRRRVDDPVAAAALAWHQQISALLDLHVFDDDEDNAECDKDPTLNESALDFIDDDEEPQEAPVLLHQPTEDVGRLAQIAARFEQDTATYTKSAQSEQTEMREVSAEASVVAQTTILRRAVQDTAHSILPRPAPNLDRADGHCTRCVLIAQAAKVPGAGEVDPGGKGTIEEEKGRQAAREAGQAELPLSKKMYPQVYPTLDELEPFQRSRRPIFTITDFLGHAQALQLCDRVKIWRGACTSTVGYIVDVLDVKVNRKDPPGGQTWVTMMKLSPVLLLPSVGGEIAREWFQLGALRCHVLSPSPPLQLSTVCESLGTARPFKDVHGNRASIPMTNVERAFRVADKVIVKQGEHKGHQGIVLDCGFFFLEIFDVGPGHILDDVPTMQHEAIMQRHTFRVPLVNIDFDMFRDSTSNPEYFPAQSTVSVVSHPDVSPEQIARFKERLVKRAQEQGCRYEGLHVMVVDVRMDLRVHSARSDNGLVRMSSVFKGRRGLIIGDHDSTDRIQILFTTPATRRRQQMRRDTHGIMVTISSLPSQTKYQGFPIRTFPIRKSVLSSKRGLGNRCGPEVAEHALQ